MTKLHFEELNEENEVDLYFSNEYLTLMFLKEEKMGLIQAIAEYIPINKFKEVFELAAEMIEEYALESLIFDKRGLTSFHQPTMEWYFVHWKPRVRKMGLTNHYKILPSEEWFKKCVEAGRKQILDKHSETIFEGISIQYVNLISEAIEDRRRKNEGLI
jgi:hypothetical protein